MSAFEKWFDTAPYFERPAPLKAAWIAALKRAEEICRERADTFRGKNTDRVTAAVVCADAIAKEIEREHP